MIEFKGTKGIWEITKECSNGIVEEELAINIKSNEDLMFDICAVWVDLHTREEAKANALLISKAPEMLEMLNILLYDYKNYIQNISQDSHRNNRINEIEQLIKQATEL